MKISIYGMGYVGVVSAACLAHRGHTIIGIDPIESKVNDLSRGQTPIQEPEVAELLQTGYIEGRLFASTTPADGVRNADMIWVCVGTPSSLEKGLDLSHVESVSSEIGLALKEVENRPLLVYRSTMLPGSMQSIVIPALEKSSGLKAGVDFHVVFHPEFLRESSAVYDFDQPPKIVIGESKPGTSQLLTELYSDFDAPKFNLSLGEAEMVKYADNLFHALKVTFANEVGAIAHSAGIDARRVAEVFVSDTKLNLSPYYLRPGFAFGGSCLPKDLRAILRYATIQAVPVPMLSGIMESNKSQIDTFVERICKFKPKKVGMVGLAFKSNTDDMRESPYVEVAKRLIGEGMSISIFDPSVDTENLIGANKQLINTALGHLRTLLVDNVDKLNQTELIIVNHATITADQIDEWIESGIHVMDLASIKGVHTESPNYHGISW